MASVSGFGGCRTVSRGNRRAVHYSWRYAYESLSCSDRCLDPEHCEATENLSYAAGDVTVHSNLCVHSAGLNLTDRPRWTYMVIVNPADACWNGGPADAFDTRGLRLHEVMDDGRFPVIG